MALNIGEFLKNSARRWPDRIAAATRAGTLSFSQLDRKAAALALKLRTAGIEDHAHVMFVLPNSLEWLVCYQGILQAGAVPVPLNPRLASPEIAAMAADCRPSLMIAAADHYDALNSQCASQGIRIVAQEELALLDSDAEPFGLPPRRAEDTALVLYSSGSTGLPKGVELSHEAICWNAQVFAYDLLDLRPGDRGYSALPLSHVFGHTCFMSASLFAGASIWLEEKFDARQCLAEIARQGISYFMGVPTMFWAMARAESPEGADYSRWRACVSGGQALPVDVHRYFEDRFDVMISEGYGMTEAAPSIVGWRLTADGRREGSAGQPYFGVNLRIVDDSGLDVPTGEIGEILIQSPGVARGYLNKPELTASTFRDGWLYSGDYGRLDEDSFLYIVGRKKEMIVSGGYNIYPREVEEVFYQLPDVLEASVVAAAHERLGEMPVAFVVPAEGRQISREALLDHCTASLARYKVPREIYFLKQLPRNATGKVDRLALGRLAKQHREDLNEHRAI